MKVLLSRSFLCLGVVLSVWSFSSPMATAELIIVGGGGHKSKTKHAPGWTAPAGAPAAESDASDEKPITINGDAFPSATLQPFLDLHLDRILAPLGGPAFTQTDIIAGIKDAYARSMLKAPDAHKPAYQLALVVCDALANAVGEREKAVAALNGAYDNRRSEAVQPRGGKKAVKDADKDEAFFYESQKNTWKQNASSLRQLIAVAYQRERMAENAAGEWPMPTPLPPEAVPSPAAAAAAPGGPDPVIGQWMLEGRSSLALTADNQISGAQQGTWRYTGTSGAGRNYELHLGTNGWVDYLLLSNDGKLLDGKTKKGKRISASRS